MSVKREPRLPPAGTAFNSWNSIAGFGYLYELVFPLKVHCQRLLAKVQKSGSPNSESGMSALETI